MGFADQLKAKAAKNVKTIILPEGDEIRVLKAADEVIGEKAANIIIVGEQSAIDKAATDNGLKNLADATVVSHSDSDLLAATTEKFIELRAGSAKKKAEASGGTFDEAQFATTAAATVAKDVSMFATLLVKLGKADGMVSGAVHTTADTIRPALQIIKTKPGRKTVSGAFFMCVPVSGAGRTDENVLVFADCAVNPNPTPEIIADIAIASDETAKAFGLDSKVALLNYSTIDSGKGPDVDATLEALEVLKIRVADEKLTIDYDGPLQFDAATDEDVAKTKAPNSKVAGKATVFVFPDLKSGNITYKAVQRTANALAIGPVLQGLNAPVNDLSRGALVEDIVNTIYLTAVQAGE
jgi:phosphate acetyltransferase